MAPPLSFLLLIFIPVFFPPPSLSLSFTFPSFNSSSLQLIDFQNDAFFDKVIKLTKNEIGSSISRSVGRAVYSDPFILWDAASGNLADFTTHFSFIINAFNRTVFGDGLTFFLSPFPSSIPSNSSGGYLGLVNDTTFSNASAGAGFVAVEFDTFKNQWDPSDNHIGIDINSVESAAAVAWESSLRDGRIGNAWVSYNASEKNLSVYLTYQDNPSFAGESILSHTVDLRNVLPEKVAVGFSAATGFFVETHNILSWNFTSSLEPMENQRKNRASVGFGVIIAIGLLLLLVGFVWFLLWRRRWFRKSPQEAKKADFDDDDEDIDANIDSEFEKGRGRGSMRFSYADLAAATKNFAGELKLGEGGFGGVYKGYLANSKTEVAIKRVSRGSKQGKKEYIAEVKIISNLRHRNLVQLVGWCHGSGELILVYEFMPNGSLDTYLYDSQRFLAWHLRYKVVLGLGSAVLYLHEEWEECVVHRDIKPSNVMLDAAFNAKLGDFGLARLVDHDRGMQTTVLAGTMGYLAPECLTSGRASKESDVYAFGMVALELACGRRPVEPKERAERVGLVSWVWDLYGGGRMLEAADERLNSEFDAEEMKRLMVVGLWCLHPDLGMRPSIRQALAVLKDEAPPPCLPQRMPVPMYYCSPPPPLLFTDTITGTTTSSSGSLFSQSTTNSSGVASEPRLPE
ncbi:L-type lectin-domain containing receptor kinase IX.1 [Platanthera zijinensis]|uniref:non-specific serine/threonine protein kinase n=1 Tax=Platanthera zijinensis TaxID=2320716 RepID=A0AAP0BMK5_9ASPA